MNPIDLKVALGFGLLIMAATHADAQNNCAARETVIQRLADRYGETRQALGLAQQGAVFEMFASENSGSWTITVTMPNGTTCLVASGQAYEELAEALPPQGDGA
ncbi:hypothetical protein [Shimia haliotis]|uniref:Uncharacterized protein n=1 Tax=Shimia haliotis TaxID=1280847 RepID=A0A1I4CT32_9RHOB|nr:hypothetical protein [Shimia haliotis]SFK83459.1 hypothetical protein SAMN04488036_102439 [Shimia haliotis]